ncbi:hypothetical protein [Azospirillum endophyticum]
MGIDAFASPITGHASARAPWHVSLFHDEEKMIGRLHLIFSAASPRMPDRF